MRKGRHGGGRQRLHFILLGGFTAVLALLALLAGVALRNMADVNARLDLIVHNHNQKKALVETMHRSVQGRIASLQRMLLLEDPFERDSEAQRLDTLAADFVTARDRFANLALTPAERAALQRQGRDAAEAVPLQRAVAELIRSEQLGQAHRLLVSDAIPAQDRVLATLDVLLALQDSATGAAFDEALASHRRARADLLLLTGSAGLFAVVIALATIRRVQQTEARLSREKERAEVTLGSIGDGVISTDAEGRIEAMNAAAEQLTGCRFGDYAGRPLSDALRLVDGLDGRPLATSVDALLALEPDELQLAGMLLQRNGGGDIPIEYTLSPIHEEDGRTGLVVIFRDVSEHRAHARQLQHAARHDPLTGLLNRREFERRLERALDAARRGDGQHVLCFLDLDRFKAVNDSAGHAAGDELLRQLAERLRSRVRGNDSLARLGGDEFGLLLEECPLTKALKLADGLREAVTELRFLWENNAHSIGVSIGLVTLGTDAGSVAEMMALADGACYSAKESGRGCVYVAERPAAGSPPPTRQCIDRLRQALREDGFVLHTQEVVGLSGAGDEPMCEVLLRISDGEGERPPMAFLPTAERYHLIPAIDLWVVEKTLERLWQVPDQRIYGINLGAQSVRDAEFPARLEQAFRRHGVDPGRICFEVTETAAMANLSRFGEMVRRLRRLGCRFALDDFGSGVGSFSYLRGVSVDFLKIEGRLTYGLERDPVQRALLDSIHRLGRVFGMRTVAKRIEDPAMVAILNAVGIDYGQGFGLARPQPLTA